MQTATLAVPTNNLWKPAQAALTSINWGDGPNGRLQHAEALQLHLDQDLLATNASALSRGGGGTLASEQRLRSTATMPSGALMCSSAVQRLARLELPPNQLLSQRHRDLLLTSASALNKGGKVTLARAQRASTAMTRSGALMCVSAVQRPARLLRNARISRESALDGASTVVGLT